MGGKLNIRLGKAFLYQQLNEFRLRYRKNKLQLIFHILGEYRRAWSILHKDQEGFAVIAIDHSQKLRKGQNQIQADQHHNRPFFWPTETDTVRAKHNKLGNIIRETDLICELFFSFNFNLFGPHIGNNAANHQLNLMENHDWQYNHANWLTNKQDLCHRHAAG